MFNLEDTGNKVYYKTYNIILVTSIRTEQKSIETDTVIYIKVIHEQLSWKWKRLSKRTRLIIVIVEQKIIKMDVVRPISFKLIRG